MPDTYDAMPTVAGAFVLMSPSVDAMPVYRAANLFSSMKNVFPSASMVPFSKGIGGTVANTRMESPDDNAPISNFGMGVTSSYDEGSPNAPCLCLWPQNVWRFKWTVKNGSRKIKIRTKCGYNVGAADERPSLTIKKNLSIGITQDVSGSAAIGTTDWVTIGPVIVTPTSTGVVWVELKNNLVCDRPEDPTQISAYFDHITVS